MVLTTQEAQTDRDRCVLRPGNCLTTPRGEASEITRQQLLNEKLQNKIPRCRLQTNRGWRRCETRGKHFFCCKTREQLRATNYQLAVERGLKALSSAFWQETLRWCGKWVKAHPSSHNRPFLPHRLPNPLRGAVGLAKYHAGIPRFLDSRLNNKAQSQTATRRHRHRQVNWQVNWY